MKLVVRFCLFVGENEWAGVSLWYRGVLSRLSDHKRSQWTPRPGHSTNTNPSLVGVGEDGRLFHLGRRGVGPCVGDVLPNCAREELRVLHDDADLPREEECVCVVCRGVERLSPFIFM